MVAVVGSGGKTTFLARLAAELAADGEKVVLTTTTHIFPPSRRLAAPAWLWGEAAPGVDELAARLAPGRVLVVARGVNPQGKLTGLDPEQLARLAASGAWVLVEADGSKQRPLKSWAEWEPAWPAPPFYPVVVAGASGLGRPLTEEWVHRPRLFAQAAGLALGQAVTPLALARVLAGPEGPLARLPQDGEPARRAVLVVNQADAVAPALLGDLGRELDALADAGGAAFNPRLAARLAGGQWRPL